MNEILARRGVLSGLGVAKHGKQIYPKVEKMNERIKELTIQALAECDPTKMTPLSSSVDNGDGVDIPLEFSKKFAELIVREAARFFGVEE
jgi:hypothetical protein